MVVVQGCECCSGLGMVGGESWPEWEGEFLKQKLFKHSFYWKKYW